MAVSNGVTNGRGVWSKKYSDGSELYYSTFVEYTSGQNGRGLGSNQLKTYVLYKRPRGLVTEWVTGGVLSPDGKIIPLKNSEASRLIDGKLERLGSGGLYDYPENDYVLGDLARKDLVSGGTDSLRYQTINNAKYLLKKDSGVSSQEVDNAFDISHNITPPGRQPTPSIIGTPLTADQSTSETSSNQPETLDGVNIREDYNNVTKINDFLKGTYVYPNALRNNGQDYIQFSLYEYGTRDAKTSETSTNVADIFKLTPRTETPLGKVFLPIQQGISDQNMVSWADENMSPLAIAMMQSAANPENIGGNVIDIAGKITNNAQYQKLIKQQLYGAAAGVNPLARLSGLVINPNLELLFNGPTLRPFNFTFRLSPRDDIEGKAVKDIIRWFKQGSAVRTSKDNLFLKAPNVFKIQYIYGENKQGDNNPVHKGLNQIKTCALRSMNVNYNPDGSYMTFEDGTMTSYEMTLQFSELEPVYDVDYEQSPKSDIGY